MLTSGFLHLLVPYISPVLTKSLEHGLLSLSNVLLSTLVAAEAVDEVGNLAVYWGFNIKFVGGGI